MKVLDLTDPANYRIPEDDLDIVSPEDSDDEVKDVEIPLDRNQMYIVLRGDVYIKQNDRPKPPSVMSNPGSPVRISK